MSETPCPAKRSPDGFVAQRFPVSVNGHGNWVRTGWLDDEGIDVEVLTDEAVADWPDLVEAASSSPETGQ